MTAVGSTCVKLEQNSRFGLQRDHSMTRSSGTKVSRVTLVLFGSTLAAFGLVAAVLAVKSLLHEHAILQMIDTKADPLLPLGASVYARPDGTIYRVEFNPPFAEELTDRHLRHLSSIRTIEYLDLSGTSISDEGLGALVPLTRLRELVLFDTMVTEEGVAYLRRAVPDCEIRWAKPTEESK